APPAGIDARGGGDPGHEGAPCPARHGAPGKLGVHRRPSTPSGSSRPVSPTGGPAPPPALRNGPAVRVENGRVLLLGRVLRERGVLAGAAVRHALLRRVFDHTFDP